MVVATLFLRCLWGSVRRQEKKKKKNKKNKKKERVLEFGLNVGSGVGVSWSCFS